MKYPFISAILTASCAMVLNAQSDSSTKSPQDSGQKQKKPEFVALNDCVGATVSMIPGAEARGEAAENKEVADRPTGKITDIVIDAKTGRTEWAVVSFGGLLGIGDKTVAVPCSILQWDAVAKRYDASVSHDQLKALTAFDAKRAKGQGLDDAITAHTTNWQAVVKPSAPGNTVEEASTTKPKANDIHADKPVVAIAGTTMVAVPSRFLSASEVDDYPLYARSEEFGKVSNCVIDRANGKLAFVIVGHGGVLGIGKDEYLLPFSALRLAKKADATVLVVDKSAAEMASCIKYKKPEHGIVDAETAARCSASTGEKAVIGSEESK